MNELSPELPAPEPGRGGADARAAGARSAGRRADARPREPERQGAGGASRRPSSRRARRRSRAYRFVDMGPAELPQVALAVPVPRLRARLPSWWSRPSSSFRPLEALPRDADQGVGVYLMTRDGKMLWWDGLNTAMRDALLSPAGSAPVVPRRARRRHDPGVQSCRRRRPTEVLAQVSAIKESGWVPDRPEAARRPPSPPSTG